MKVYISSSWKNRERVRAMAINLRQGGHEVYDFTDPLCRAIPEIPPERFPVQFDPHLHLYRAYLQSVPEWRGAVEYNRRALQWCEAVVLLLPCGNDAHADAFYALGLGKRLAVVGQPRAGERTLTHLWAHAILDVDADAGAWLSSGSPEGEGR